ncbi:unnamed protein product [Rhodiola kirilowii]
MEQPEGFEEKVKENMVCKLNKSLCGLKQAPRQGFKKFESFMIDQGYTKLNSDHCVFIRKFTDGDFIILLIYVDDMLIVGQDMKKITMLKKDLNKVFKMKDLGHAKQILGMHISRDKKNGKVWLSQEEYVEKILKRFKMEKAKPVSFPLGTQFKLYTALSPKDEHEKKEMDKVPYASAVGCLMYVMIRIRPDIAFAVGVVSRFFSNLAKNHWAAVKWILRYLRDNLKLCLCYGGGCPTIQAFTNPPLVMSLPIWGSYLMASKTPKVCCSLQLKLSLLQSLRVARRCRG